MGTVPELVAILKGLKPRGKRLAVGDRFTPRSTKEARDLVKLGWARELSADDTPKPPDARPPGGRPVPPAPPMRPGRPDVVVPAVEPAPPSESDRPPAAGSAEPKILDTTQPIGRPRGRPRSSS